MVTEGLRSPQEQSANLLGRGCVTRPETLQKRRHALPALGVRSQQLRGLRLSPLWLLDGLGCRPEGQPGPEELDGRIVVVPDVQEPEPGTLSASHAGDAARNASAAAMMASVSASRAFRVY